MTRRIGTHWEDCWRSHLECAIAYIKRLTMCEHCLTGLHGWHRTGKVCDEALERRECECTEPRRPR